MAQRQLSSGAVFWMKFVFPVVWSGFFGLGTIAMFLDKLHDQAGAPPSTEMKLQFLVIWVVASTYLFWNARRLKRVRLDESAIYVSNFRREYRIPLEEIAAVTQWFGPNNPVTIQFRPPTPFGERVSFFPSTQFFPFWGRHRVVDELRALARLG